MSLEEEIRSVINSHSRENVSDTPDFILAQYLINCLEAFEQASNHRQQWHGIELKMR